MNKQNISDKQFWNVPCQRYGQEQTLKDIRKKNTQEQSITLTFIFRICMMCNGASAGKDVECKDRLHYIYVSVLFHVMVEKNLMLLLGEGGERMQPVMISCA